jgi:hypothetical protein
VSGARSFVGFELEPIDVAALTDRLADLAAHHQVPPPKVDTDLHQGLLGVQAAVTPYGVTLPPNPPGPEKDKMHARRRAILTQTTDAALAEARKRGPK